MIANATRLTEVFRRELEATKSLDAAVVAVATEALARAEDELQERQLPLRLPPVLVRSEARLEEVRAVRAALRLVAADAGISVADLTDRCRKTPLVRARWVAMAILHRHLDLTCTETARALGLRDHSVVIYGLRCLDACPDLVAKAAAIVEALEGGGAGMDAEEAA